MKFNYQMRFSKTGRARFIAHLDTVSLLVRAIRRAGYDLAFTEGMRPKPILSLAMPLGVGVEGEDEICEFSLRQRAPLTDLARKISKQLPEGIGFKSVGPVYGRSKAASRVESVSYRIELENPPGDYARAMREYNAIRDPLVILRRRPKGDKEIDIRKYVPHVDLDDRGRGIVFDMRVTAGGTGRPEEIIEALRILGSKELEVSRTVRTGIVLGEEQRPAPAWRGGLAQRRGAE